MANRVQIPISFSYEVSYYVATSSGGSPTQQVAMMLPAAGSTITVVNRVTSQPAIVYASSTGTGTITPIVTDAGGNVPGYVSEGSYTIQAASAGSFSGASVNWEAVYGAGVGNVASAAVDIAQLTAQVAAQLRPPIGSIVQYGGSGDPVDTDGITRWMICDGRSLSQTGTYANLYTAIGSVYGSGSGTFNIPDLRGRIAVGPDAGTSRLRARTLSGVTNGNVLGSTGGADSESLQISEMPSHNHPTSENAHGHGPGRDGSTFWTHDPNHSHGLSTGMSIVSHNLGISKWSATGETQNNGVLLATNGAPALAGINAGGTGVWLDYATTGLTVNYTGGSGAHNNTQPYLVVNHIIRVV